MPATIAAYDELGITDFPVVILEQFWQPSPPPVDAIIISDIHLGAENCQAKPLADFLQSLLDGNLPARRLIINGDVFDSIDFRRLKKSHWKVLSQIRHLSDKLEIIWIVGNHDGSADIISHLLGVQVVEEFILESAGNKFLIIHGHQFDDFINDHPILTALADLAYWALQKIDRSHVIARLAKKRSKTFVRCSNKIRNGATQLAARKNCHAAICGHTHHAAAEQPWHRRPADDPANNPAHDPTNIPANSPLRPTTTPTRQSPTAYYNSGCWTESPSTYLLVNAGKVSLETYTEAPTLTETSA